MEHLQPLVATKGERYIINTYMFPLQKLCLIQNHNQQVILKVKKHEVKEIKKHLISRKVEVVMADPFDGEIIIVNPYYIGE